MRPEPSGGVLLGRSRGLVRFIIKVTSLAIWAIGVLNLITKSPDPPSSDGSYPLRAYSATAAPRPPKKSKN